MLQEHEGRDQHGRRALRGWRLHAPEGIYTDYADQRAQARTLLAPHSDRRLWQLLWSMWLSHFDYTLYSKLVANKDC